MADHYTDQYLATRARPLLAFSWMPWATSAVVITMGQILMWNGWNASGEWVPVTGWSAVWAYALSAAFAVAPVVLGLFVLAPGPASLRCSYCSSRTRRSPPRASR